MQALRRDAVNAVTEASHLSTVAQDLEQDRQQPLQIQPLSGRIGAVVHGLSLIHI